MSDPSAEAALEAMSADELAALEARARVEKLALEQEKLRLETRALTRTVSRQGLWLEWLKAASVPVAVLSVFVTATIGFVQLRQADQARANERLDKAASRLASKEVSERMAGVAGLRLVISEPDESRRKAAVLFLVNAVSLETQPEVQGAILDLFHDVGKQDRNAEVLDAGLASAIERNRIITAALLKDVEARRDLDRRKRLSEVVGEDLTLEEGPLAPGVFRSKPLEALLSTLRRPADFTATLSPPERTRLEGLASAVSILTRLGGKARDYSGIYCEGCDFSGQTFTPGTNFEKALLAKATFERADLRQASFRNADLGGTVFFAAKLDKADLSWTEKDQDGLVALNTARHGSFNAVFPFLECASLKGADLSGRTLLAVERQYSQERPGIALLAPQTRFVQIDGETRMTRIGIIFSRRFSDSYLRSLSEAERARKADEIFSVWSGGFMGFPVVFNQASRIAPRREDADATMTFVDHIVSVDRAELGRAAPWERELPRMFFEREPWASGGYLERFGLKDVVARDALATADRAGKTAKICAERLDSASGVLLSAAYFSLNRNEAVP